jgi:hypothetical protein
MKLTSICRNLQHSAKEEGAFNLKSKMLPSFPSYLEVYFCISDRFSRIFLRRWEDGEIVDYDHGPLQGTVLLLVLGFA